jgi:hypothetical protein
MSYKSLKLQITGVVPLLMHRGGLADPLDSFAKQMKKLSGKKDKTDADFEELARTEWYGSLYLSDGKPCIPGELVEAVMITAARRSKRGKQVQAGLLCPDNYLLQYDGQAKIDDLWKNPEYRLTVGVRVKQNRVMRTRPRFPQWKFMADIQFDSSMLNPEEVLNIARKGGEEVGLGDWRPKFGRFSVELL